MANMQRPPRKPRTLTAARPPERLHGVALEITNRCQLDCLQCSRSSVMDRPLSEMTPGQAAALARAALGSGMVGKDVWISFGLAGEPLMHSKIGDIIDAILSVGFQRIMIYSSLVCPESRFMKFLDVAARQTGVYLHASAHFWQATGEFDGDRFNRWWKALRDVMGSRIDVGICVPESDMIESARKKVSNDLGVGTVDINADLPCDLFAMHGLEEQCECRESSRCLAAGMYITVEGDCSLCCHDLKPTMTLGRVLDVGFREAYMRKLKLFDRMRTKEKFPDHCQRCACFPSLKKQVVGGWV